MKYVAALVMALLFASCVPEYIDPADAKAFITREESKTLIFENLISSSVDRICTFGDSVLRTFEGTTPTGQIVHFGELGFPRHEIFTFAEELKVGLYIDDYFSTLEDFENDDVNTDVSILGAGFSNTQELVDAVNECAPSVQVFSPGPHRVFVMTDELVCSLSPEAPTSSVEFVLANPTLLLDSEQLDGIPCMDAGEWRELRGNSAGQSTRDVQ